MDRLGPVQGSVEMGKRRKGDSGRDHLLFNKQAKVEGQENFTL